MKTNIMTTNFTKKATNVLEEKKKNWLFFFFWIGVLMGDRWRRMRAVGQDLKQNLVFDIVQMYVSTYVHG